MNMQQQLNEHTIPNGGWRFRQVQTGWEIKNPVSVTFSQATVEIIKHRMKNPAICAKHNLSTEPDVVSAELMAYNRKRLGIPEPTKGSPGFFGRGRSLGAGVVAAAANIRRAAQGTSVWMDWLAHGGVPVEQPLAEARAATCVDCPKNVKGEWYVEAPAELLKGAIEDWKKVTGRQFEFKTGQGDNLKSCDVCKCLSKVKVFVPLKHIAEHTKPEIMAEFPDNCWVKKEMAQG